MRNPAMTPCSFLVGALAAAVFAPIAMATTLSWMELEGALAERAEPLAALLSGEAQPTLRELVATFDEAASRADLDGVVLRLRQPALTMTQVEEIGEAITRLRDAGKRVHLFTEIYGPVELVLGAYCDEVIAQSGAAVSLPGAYMEEMYLADALGMIGVKADFVQVGDYKGAAETLVNTEPSKAWNQNISQLLDSRYETLREHIERGRNFTGAQLDEVMERAWFISSEEAASIGLVDAAVDRLSLNDHLETQYGEFDFEINENASGSLMEMSNPFAIFQMLMEEPDNAVRRNSIAVLHVNGAIIDGESTEGGILGGSGSVGSLTMREALADIEHEPKIRGLIVRIDSPGGSAIASESIWLGVNRVAKKKPVWISVGSMAASGGYYIAVSGDRIYVNPSSIVGSIGVVGGKYVLGGAYEKLNINVIPRGRGPMASLASTLIPWTPEQRGLVRERMAETYEQFVARVKAGRPDIDISQTAEGRLFSGDKAIAMNMADKIGGIDTAINDLARELNLAKGAYDVVNFPPPKSLAEIFESMIPGTVRAPGLDNSHSAIITEGAGLLRELVGPRAWPGLRDSMNALLHLRNEPVLLASPRALIFR